MLFDHSKFVSTIVLPATVINGKRQFMRLLFIIFLALFHRISVFIIRTYYTYLNFRRTS